MAKGIAVVSGSNDVVFKALETGIITAGSKVGSTGTYAQVGISGSLSVSGSDGTPSFYANENGVQISGSFAFKGDLQVTGNVFASENISASLDLKAGRNLIAAGNLDVEGTGNIAKKLTVQADGLEVTAGNLDVVAGNISGSSNLNIGGNLDLAGTAGIGSTLTVESGGAYVTGDISGSANLLAGGNLVVAGNATIVGDLTVTGNTTVTVDNVSNMQIKDAIIHVGSGSSTAGKDLGLVFGSELAKGFSVEDGIFRLGSTTSDATSASIDVANDGELRLGILSASAGIYVDGRLEVTDNVVLGSSAADVLTINSQVTASGDFLLSGKLTASADVLMQEDVTMGTDSDDLIKVVGQIRMPIFTVSGVNQVAGYPLIPADYVANKAAYNGHMFYLTSSDDTNWTADSNWLQGNKWYFNERGDWHASFLFAE